MHSVEETRTWRDLYQKPVVLDECGYEGDVPHQWGCITPQEMARRFWETAVRGGYCGHGETYLHPEEVLWWPKGGVLHGQSPSRIAFFRRILEEGPPEGHEPIDGVVGGHFPCAGRAGEYYLTCFGLHQPRQQTLNLPIGARFRGKVIDTWEMTITPLPGPLEGQVTLDLPARPYIAVRLRRET